MECIYKGKEYQLVVYYCTLTTAKNAILINSISDRVSVLWDGSYVSLGLVSNATYTSSKQFDSVVKGLNTAVVENHIAGVNQTLTCDIIPKRTDLIVDLIENEFTGKEYTVLYENAIRARTMKMVVAGITEYSPMNNILKMQIQFSTKKKA